MTDACNCYIGPNYTNRCNACVELSKREDPRKRALKDGLRQLRTHELMWLVRRAEVFNGAMLLDRDEEGHANLSKGVYCPLACAVAIPLSRSTCEGYDLNTDEGVAEFLAKGCGFKIYNTRGIKGEFYTTNRREDLLTAAKEVLAERE